MKKTIYLTILTIVTVLCIISGTVYHVSGWLGHFWNWGWNWNSSDLDHSRVTYSEDLDSFDSIVLETSVMDITIESGDTYHLTYDCVSYLVPEVKVENGKLTLKQPSVPHFGGNNNYCEMTLTIPEDTALTKAETTCDVGNLILTDITADKADFQTDVGNIEADNCTFTSFKANTDVGNIQTDNTDLGKSEMDVDVGDINIINGCFTDLDLSVDLGNAAVDSTVDLSDYKIDLSTDFGSVTVNGEKHKRSFKQSSSKNGSRLRLTIENSTGNIDVVY